MITLGKRPRKGFSSSTPGALGFTPGHKSGPRNVPYGSNIPVQNVSSQIHTQTNTTASVPLLIKPWRNNAHIEYFPGDIIFTKRGIKGRLQTIADLTQMNKGMDATDKARDSSLDTYNFFGVYRNETNIEGSSSMSAGRLSARKQQMLINVDVFGRSRIANIFGAVKQGDHVGLMLFKDEEQNATWQYRPCVNGQVPKKINATYIGEGEFKESLHIPIGVVSFTSRPVSAAAVKEALNDRDKMTKLPQIEILML